jgi:hypothetical protein
LEPKQTAPTVLTDKTVLASFTSNVISMLVLTSGSLMTFTLNSIGPKDIDKYNTNSPIFVGIINVWT